MNTRVISFINEKGGVAKTTTTVGVATVLAGAMGKKVLVIDLDPQTNCTTILIGGNKWKELDEKGNTLYTLFYDALDPMNRFDFNINNTLQKGVSAIDEVKTLDLLPSSRKLSDIQDKILSVSGTGNNPYEILKNGIESVIKKYDYVFIDCPANINAITLNGLRISDAYIIPVIPEPLSVDGIPQIITQIKKFSKQMRRDIKCLGIVPTKVRSNIKQHKFTIELLKTKNDMPPVFDTVFTELVAFGDAAIFVPRKTLTDMWGKVPLEQFKSFVGEMLKKAEWTL